MQSWSHTIVYWGWSADQQIISWLYTDTKLEATYKLRLRFELEVVYIKWIRLYLCTWHIHIQIEGQRLGLGTHWLPLRVHQSKLGLPYGRFPILIRVTTKVKDPLVPLTWLCNLVMTKGKLKKHFNYGLAIPAKVLKWPGNYLVTAYGQISEKLGVGDLTAPLLLT